MLEPVSRGVFSEAEYVRKVLQFDLRKRREKKRKDPM